MRLAAIVWIFLMSIAMASQAFAQTNSGKQRDSIAIPSGKTEIQYHKTEEVPRQVRAVIGPTCRYAERLNDLPVRVIRPSPQGRYFAIVHCNGITVRSMAFTDIHSLAPQPAAFAVKAMPSGFGVTSLPGYLEWDEGRQVLTALDNTDTIPSDEWRHTYRYVSGNQSFVLDRIEHRIHRGGRSDEPWTSYWKAPDWHAPK